MMKVEENNIESVHLLILSNVSFFTPRIISLTTQFLLCLALINKLLKCLGIIGTQFSSQEQKLPDGTNIALSWL